MTMRTSWPRAGRATPRSGIGDGRDRPNQERKPMYHTHRHLTSLRTGEATTAGADARRNEPDGPPHFPSTWRCQWGNGLPRASGQDAHGGKRDHRDTTAFASLVARIWAASLIVEMTSGRVIFLPQHHHTATPKPAAAPPPARGTSGARGARRAAFDMMEVGGATAQSIDHADGGR